MMFYVWLCLIVEVLFEWLFGDTWRHCKWYNLRSTSNGCGSGSAGCFGRLLFILVWLVWFRYNIPRATHWLLGNLWQEMASALQLLSDLGYRVLTASSKAWSNLHLLQWIQENMTVLKLPFLQNVQNVQYLTANHVDSMFNAQVRAKYFFACRFLVMLHLRRWLLVRLFCRSTQSAFAFERGAWLYSCEMLRI